MRPSIVLLCNRTENAGQPWAECGDFEVVSVDVQPARNIMANHRHIRADVRTLSPGEVSHVAGVIAFPPCTHLASVGAGHWDAKGDEALLEALAIVDACCRLITAWRPRFWLMENPHGRISRYMGPAARTVQPWEWAGYAVGNAEAGAWTKQTCLWGNFSLPEKQPVDPVGSLTDMVRDADARSVTPAGLARAIFRGNYWQAMRRMVRCEACHCDMSMRSGQRFCSTACRVWHWRESQCAK